MGESKPTGVEFFDKASGRDMILCLYGEWSGWIFYYNNGNWTSLRKATKEDKKNLLPVEFNF